MLCSAALQDRRAAEAEAASKAAELAYQQRQAAAAAAAAEVARMRADDQQRAAQAAAARAEAERRKSDARWGCCGCTMHAWSLAFDWCVSRLHALPHCVLCIGGMPPAACSWNVIESINFSII
jgi:hypothetical protein